MRLWRICRERYAASALSGEGSRFAGGRWNSIGMPVVYMSSSLALAAIEVFVHVKADEEPADLVSVCAEVPFAAQEFAARQKEVSGRLHTEWRRRDEGETRLIGDTWAAARGSLVMPVPSVVIEGEWNVLINPEHEDGRRLRVVEQKRFSFDTRMFKVRHGRDG